MANFTNKMDMPLTMATTGAFPLDAKSYFESYSEAEAAAAGAAEAGTEGKTYYFGQTLTVVENGEATTYIIQPGGTLTQGSGGLLEEGLEPTAIQQADTGAVAGVKGFYWTEVISTFPDPVPEGYQNTCSISVKLAKTTFDNGLVEPTEEEIREAFAIGDILTIHAGSKFDKAATVYDIYCTDFFNKFCHLQLDVTPELLKAILNNKNNEYTSGMEFSDNAVFCPAKPDAGIVDFGKGAFAVGENSKAINYGAIASGRDNEAYGQYASAFGRKNSVGYAGFAAGRDNTVTGESAAALNQGNTASGNWSFAGGYKSQATNSSAIAYGHSAKATGLYSTAFGEQTEANGAGTFAVGRHAKAEGEASQALGRGTVAKSAYQFVVGKYNVEDNTETYAQIIGGGHADDNRINIYTVDWKGNAWYAGDVKAGNISLTTAAETANQAKSLATTRPGLQKRSYNELYNYENENAVNCFRGSTEYSHAEGYIFGGVEYHYIEDSSFAHLEGSQNRIKQSSGAHASGEWHQIVESKDAAAFGHNNYVYKSNNGFAAGQGNTVAKACQAVVGRYNDTDSSALFIVGNGSSELKSNAFVVRENGTGYLGGKKILVEGDVVESANGNIHSGTTTPNNNTGVDGDIYILYE